ARRGTLRTPGGHHRHAPGHRLPDGHARADRRTSRRGRRGAARGAPGTGVEPRRRYFDDGHLGCEDAGMGPAKSRIPRRLAWLTDYVAHPKHGPLPALLIVLTVATGMVDAVSILAL